MDHDTAIRTNATERYFLGELTGDDRHKFEEHFFMCPECTEDLRALTVLAANAKAVLRDEASGPVVHAGVLMSGKALWLSAGLNAILLIGLMYQTLKVAPEIRQELAAARAPQFVQEVSVLGVSRSAGAAVREISPATRRVVFSFYLPEQFQTVGYELKDESGAVHSKHSLPAPPKEQSAESHISLSTAGLKPGAYEISFWGTGAGGQTPIGSSKFRIASE